MRHTPYGYDILEGKAVINEEQAGILRKICENYLSGMSFKAAARDVGIDMNYSGVRRMIQNKKYLGDDFYPAILTQETADRIEAERIRRESKVSWERPRGMRKAVTKLFTSFSAPKISRKYDDPISQAEYAYSQIRNEVSE